MDIKERRRSTYLANREKKIEYQMERYKHLSSVFTKWKQTLSCSMCGESDPACLDFHHVNQNEKEIKITTAVGRGSNAIIKELKKCVVVCANCHRKVHAHGLPANVDEELSKSFEKVLVEQ